MTEVEDTYIAATAAFQKAQLKKAKNPKAFNAAEKKLHAARIAWRTERDEAQTLSATESLEKR